MSSHKKNHLQPQFRYSSLARSIAWANISFQILFPLAVAFTPAMTAYARIAPELPGETENTVSRPAHEQKIAALASNAGTFLSSHPDSDATRNFITGMATAKANQEIQQWLGKYGTARVKLNVDKDFSLKDSSLEMLYPFYDTPSDMFFTQGAIHRTDDRTQSNIGFGWRHFSANDWMAGVNTFIDHDLSRSHTRFGIGAEYWRDYMKLSANGYIRASKWKNAPDVEDYQERPANGWDIRAEGYLPAYPQLGASLMYEQYYGDEVGLFGKDERQKDPHAITAGINYTPFPLLTLSAEHKQGKGGQNDTRFGLEVNYRIGEPLTKQLDTDSVRERRMLAGSRYDLVDRNNNIVLEYRKTEVIRIALPTRIEGKSGQTVSLGLVVSKATHGLKNVQWEAPSLLAAGGKITGQGSQWELTLPAFQPGKDNRYAISAIAYDTKGNASKRVQTEVVITGAGISADRTTLTLGGQNSIEMLANGTDQKPLVLILRDTEGQPVVGMKDQITTQIAFKPAGNIVTRSRSPIISEVREIDNGMYEAIFTAGTQSGEATITVDVDGMRKSVSAKLRATMMDVAKSTFKAEQTAAEDGLQSYTLTLTAVDADGNPVTGEANRLRFVPQDGRGVNISNVTEIQPGVYVATVSSTRVGQITVQVFSDQYQLGNLQATLNFITAPIDAAHSSLTLNPKKANVGGTVTATWLAKDAYDNPVSGVAPDVLSFAGAAAAGTSVSGWTDNGNGSWTAQITLGTTAGQLIVMPRVNGKDAIQQPVSLNVAGDATQAKISDIEVKVDNQVADGQSADVIALTVKDVYGNPLQDQAVTLTLPEGMSSKADDSITTGADGKATIELSSTIAGARELTVSVNGDEKRVTLKYTADASSAQTTLEIDNAGEKVANGTDAFDLTANVHDKQGNPIHDALVIFNLPKGVRMPDGTSNHVYTDKEGNAKLKVVSVNAGTFEVTAATVNGQASAPQKISFVADQTTAIVTDIEVVNNSAIANGTTKQNYKVTVKDANNNLLQGSEVTLTSSQELTITPAQAKTNEQGQAMFSATTTVAGTYTLTAKVVRTDGQESTKTAEAKFIADEINSKLTVTPESVDGLIADGQNAAKLELSVMAGNNPVNGIFDIEVQAPEEVTEDDYTITPHKSEHLLSGKRTITFSTRKEGQYRLTIHVNTYGGYETNTVTVTINAVAPKTDKGEKVME